IAAMFKRAGETQAGFHHRIHFPRADVACHEDHRSGEVHFAVVTEGQRSLIENAQHQVPDCIACLFDFVEEHDAHLYLLCVMPIQGFLSKQWICLTMTDISRRRTDELRDFVAMLKFGTVDFDYCSRVSEQTLRQPFDETGL